ncbi:MAG: YdcF family protein [Byssovorax sp.]
MGEPHRVDALVLLGCRIGPTGRPMLAATRRAQAAARAYRDGVAPVIVVSGGRRWGPHAEATALAAELVLEGVPEAAIVAELCSLSTHENAVFSAAILRRLGARTAAVVTCWWHLPRALENFRAAGVEVLGIPTEVRDLGLYGRAHVTVHEIISSRVDAWARGRDGALRAAAERLAGGP